MNKKGQTFQGVYGLIFSITFLIIGVIIALVVVSNVGTIDDELYTTVDGGTIVNETVTSFNETVGDVLAQFGTKSNVECVGVAVINASNNVPIPANNWSIAKTTCVLTGNLLGNVYLGYNVKATYTWTYRATTTSASYMQGNLTGGIDKISTYVPTVMLIMAIVLILAILGILVLVWKKMGMGSGGL